MAKFGISVVSEFGTELCAACYDLEEDFPFILYVYINVLKRLEYWIESVKNTQEGYPVHYILFLQSFSFDT